MPKYLQVHEKLEETRLLAAKNKSIPGPTIVIAGPTDSGKSSLCRTLIGWAARMGHQPVFVDIDVGQNGITVPGVISAVAVQRPPPVTEGIAGCKAAPMVLNYGHTSLDINPALYRVLTQNMDAIVREKMEADPVVKRSGIVVNTCGWVDGLGYDLLLYAVKAFRADIVVILDHEKLFHYLRADLADRPEIDVQLLPKSGGVVTRSSELRRKTRLSCIREYFYGPAGELCPHSMVISMPDVRIFRIGGAPAAPSSALPIGQAPQYDPLCAVEVLPSQDLTYSLAAVVYCSDPSELLRASVAGFLYISKVDLDRRTLTVLSPCPGALPSRILVVGTIKWLE
jgi:polyribonucleotide 5'-hydroxyl-kinase